MTFSVGFVWAAPSVPQRDILQHCREAEKRAKSLGRDRVTIRVVFNSGQYVQWTCPWDYLHVLKNYCDREGKTYAEWECLGEDPKYLPNWSHVYTDLAHLVARHVIPSRTKEASNNEAKIAKAIFNIYFNQQGEYLSENRKRIIGDTSNQEFINWIRDLINVGWQLCSNT
jgi:CRISPR-associated protein Cmr2